MKICMGCMNQVSDNDKICPACGYDQSNVREKSYYLDPGTIIGGKFIVGGVSDSEDIDAVIFQGDAEIFIISGECRRNKEEIFHW